MINLNDGEVETKFTRWNIQKCKPGQRRARRGRELSRRHSFTAVSSRSVLLHWFCLAYLIQFFRSLPDNKHDIEYLYGNMPKIQDNI